MFSFIFVQSFKFWFENHLDAQAGQVHKIHEWVKTDCHFDTKSVIVSISKKTHHTAKLIPVVEPPYQPTLHLLAPSPRKLNRTSAISRMKISSNKGWTIPYPEYLQLIFCLVKGLMSSFTSEYRGGALKSGTVSRALCKSLESPLIFLLD